MYWEQDLDNLRIGTMMTRSILNTQKSINRHFDNTDKIIIWSRLE